MAKRGARQVMQQAIEAELTEHLTNCQCTQRATEIAAWTGQGRHASDLLVSTRDDAHAAFAKFVGHCKARYPKVIERIEKDRGSMLAFYDSPAEHWQHIRTINPVESTFATVHHRTSRTRNCVSRPALLGLVSS